MLPNWLYGKSKSKLADILGGGGGGGTTYTAGPGISINSNNRISFRGDTAPYDNSVSGLEADTVKGAIDELTKGIDANVLGEQVNLASYNNRNPYILPADGYISGFGSWGSNQAVRIYDSSFTRNIALKVASIPVYVKKGFKVYMENVATDSGANFFPLE